MSRFKTTPLLVLAEASPRRVGELVSIPEETLRSHVFWYRKKYGGAEHAKVHAKMFINRNQKAFDELERQPKVITTAQLLSMLYGLYWGYDQAFVRFANYQPGQWAAEFKEKHRYSSNGIFPYCGVVGLNRVKEQKELVTVYPKRSA